MDDAHARLVKCFSSVFPSLPAAEIPNSGVASVDGWDSIAMVTLLAVIEEEFHVQFDPSDLEAMLSFESVWNRLEKHNGQS
jgi:acyl carrier protein